MCPGQDQAPMPPDSVQAPLAAPDTAAWSSLMRWRQWDQASRNFQRNGMPEQAVAAAESAYVRSRALGISLPVAGLFWGARARQDARAGDWQLAERHIKLGILADRYSLKNFMTGFRVAARQGGWAAAFGNAVQLASEYRRDFRYQYRASRLAVFGFSLALMAGCLIFMLLLTVKEMPYLLHLTADLLPRSWPYGAKFTLVVSVFLGASSAIAAFSLPLALVIPSLSLVISGKRRQRVMVWVSMSLLGCSVAGFGLLYHFFVADSRGRVEALSRANVSDWDPELAAALSGMQEREPDDLKPAFALSLLEKRRGRMDLSRELLEAVNASAGQNSYVLNNLGNIHFFEGRMESSAVYYRQAIEADQAMAEAHHNLGQVFLKNIDFNQARTQLARAADLNPNRMERWSRESGGNLAMDALLEPELLWAEALSGWNPWPGFTPGEHYALVGVSFWLPWWAWMSWLGLALLWAWLVKDGLSAAGCHVCGRHICSRCRVSGQDGVHYCSRCHGQVFSVQSAELQQKAALSLARQSKKTARTLTLAANAVLPGISFALTGGVVKACLLSLAWGTLFAGLALIGSPWVVAVLDYRAGSGPCLAAAIAALALWLISWLPFIISRPTGREQDAAGR